MATITEKQTNAFELLSKQFGYTNRLAAPRVRKVVVSVGVGSADKRRIEVVEDRLAKITGQKSSPRKSKKSIAGFKMRQGQVVGYQTTLRGARMRDFLERFLSVALPRTRDFRGVPASAVDAMGNITLGIREHTIFPETADEELKDIFGLSVTLETTAATRAEALAFLAHLGVPFQKEPAPTR